MKRRKGEAKNYKFLIETDRARALGIDCIEMLVYFGLENYNKLQPYRKGYEQMAEDFCCGSKNKVQTAIKTLMELGLVVRTEEGAYIAVKKDNISDGKQMISDENKTEVSENKIVPSEKQTSLKERSKENINIYNNTNELNKQKVGRFAFSDDFNIFWDLFNINNLPQYDFSNRKKACYEVWQNMDDQWKEFAHDMATYHEPGENPYYWLVNEKFLLVDIDKYAAIERGEVDGAAEGAASGATDEKPHYLAGTEQEEYWKDGVTLKQVRLEDSGFFKVVTPETFEKFKGRGIFSFVKDLQPMD